MADIVPAHVIRRRLTEIVITPEHVRREESEEFHRNKERLREDGHWRCFLCGTTDALQVHHFACEWSLWPDADPEKVKTFCETFDPYGYGRLLRHKPLTSPDDIRNLLVLCETHHIAAETGVHSITMPIWLIQGLAKTGEDPVPQEDTHA
jgi:hypothetical protein